ncbi:DUF7716 domain-containing protein [Paracoccus zhejiangensis]|uniref:DUF7716 domain-containing protein n=1 Tax=Paracoccus zhejiangensis TaxID=1077935 RepID=UPI001E5FB4EA|nr:hypothetical protein [Paracoccus zhejiangensis]
MIISDVLANPEGFLWSDALYAEPVKLLSAGTPCLVHDPNDVEDNDTDLPKAAIDTGFRYVLAMQTLQSIVENLQLQGRAGSPEERLQALNFYLENDAFISIRR